MYTFNLLIKRCFDVVSSSILALLISPLLLVVALAIKLDSPGPVFFRQQRRTKGGRIFTMLKFRSMVVNAEQEWSARNEGRAIFTQNQHRRAAPAVPHHQGRYERCRAETLRYV